MRTIQILHNPKAGDKDHSEEKLVELIKKAGYECYYNSIKDDDWHKFEQKADMIAVIGGDGTVRKVAKALLNTQDAHLKPIGLLPMGTANNIAKTLHISTDIAGNIDSWPYQKSRPLDVVQVDGLHKPAFFLEGMSFGLLPQLMLGMKNIDKSTLDTPEKELEKALEMLYELALEQPAQYCRIIADNILIEGEFLIAAVMNICCIGPNIQLAPQADPGDGLMEIALVSANERQAYADHLQQKLNSAEPSRYPYYIIQARNIQITGGGELLHTDDVLIEKDKDCMVTLKVEEGKLKFLTPR